MNSDTHNNGIQFAEIRWRNSDLRMEYQWVGVRRSEQPVVVFLHEGLGSIALWKDFPEKFCLDHGLTGLVFSRYGYGQSTPRPAEERWPVSFMHAQAHEVLPAFFRSSASPAPGCSVTATAPRSPCCTRRAIRKISAELSLPPHTFLLKTSPSTAYVQRVKFI